jgi:hypothetical protein
MTPMEPADRFREPDATAREDVAKIAAHTTAA